MRLVAVIWLILITAVSLAPLPVKVALGTIGIWHNTLHVLAFFVTGVLIFSMAKNSLWIALEMLLLILFCAALELLQARLYHNPFEWRDLRFDTIGLGCAWLALLLFHRVRNPDDLPAEVDPSSKPSGISHG